MGPNSFRNLTYVAVLAVVGSLVYLIYKSSKEKKARQMAAIENSTSGSSSYLDTTSTLLPSSSAALPNEQVSQSVDGQYVAGGNKPTDYSNRSAKPVTEEPNLSEIKDVTTTPVTSTSADDAIASSEKRKAATTKTPTVNTKGIAKPTVKFDAGKVGSGEYLVVAGSFASTDNANGLVDKLKKMGFKNAEAVKLENSANTHVVAGYYDFKGGADAAARTLKANKIGAYVKKKSGEIYKAIPTVTPKSPKSTSSTLKPI